MVTVNSHVFLGRITPVFGRTQYLLGDVVLTLKATYSLDLFTRWTAHELCFFTSKANWSSRGWISTRSWPIAAAGQEAKAAATPAAAAPPPQVLVVRGTGTREGKAPATDSGYPAINQSTSQSIRLSPPRKARRGSRQGRPSREQEQIAAERGVGVKATGGRPLGRRSPPLPRRF